MKAIFKNGLSLLLALTIVLSSAVVGIGGIDFAGIFTVNVKATNSGVWEDIEWTLDKYGTLTITGTGGIRCDIETDSFGEDTWIVNIYGPFDGIKTEIKNVVICDGITYIGDYAFWNCKNLESVTIPDSVTSIDDCAFSDCVSLKSVVIPDSVTSIGDSAFSGCTSLESLVIPDGVTSIGDFAFSNCRTLKSIKIPDSVTSVGKCAFEYCTSLKSIIIPDSVTSMGERTFRGSVNLTSVTLSDNVKSIGYSTFLDCTSLDTITIPDGVTSIYDYAFYNCNVLESIILPDSVTSIGGSVFQSCTSLTSITLPDSIIDIGASSFDNTGYYDNTENWENDVLYIGKHLIKAKETFNGSCEIKSGTKTIADGAFLECDNLTAVTISNGIKSISKDAFNGCTSLKSVTIPNTVTNIAGFAFYDCTSLKSIKLPDGVKSIGSAAFYNTGYYNTATNWKNDVLYIGNHIVEAKATLSGKYEIKAGTKTVADEAFDFCIQLASVIIPNSVVSIGEKAFYNCDALKSVTIPKSVTNIGEMAFGYYLEEVDGYVFDTRDHEFEIHGIKGSAAETYAKQNRFTFKECKHTSTKWVVDKAATVNAAGSKHQECVYCGTTLKTTVVAQLKPATPKLSAVANTASGVKVTWGKISGADSYIVYRRTYNAKTKKWGGWTKLATLKGNATVSYLDKTAKSGTYNRYTVKAVNEAGASGYNTNGIKTYFLATPKVSATNAKSGVTVKWSKISGATGYIVYRKTGNGSWQKVATVKGASKVSFTDTKAKSGVTYRYTVKAYYSSYVSAHVANGFAIRRLTIPSLKSVSSSKSGITFKWNKVTGATGYIVYRKTGNGSWQKIATVKSNSYLDKTAKKGVTYKYTVRAYYGTSTSYYNTKGLTIKDKY